MLLAAKRGSRSPFNSQVQGGCVVSTPRPIAFTRGVPPVEAFPVAEIADCATAILHEDPNVLLQYGKSAGYLPLRQWLAEQHGLDVEHVFISNGSLQLMDFIAEALLK